NAIMMGARLIKSGKLDRVLVGGSDGLSKFTLNGFNTLMILDQGHSRPFDATRTGLNLGEGAGYLMLESEDVVKAESKTPLAELSGYG
ncbi:MAG: beta-ketoacyl synthase N-terminal-like domain-containing protein, partial [Flavobacteriales bacterium]